MDKVYDFFISSVLSSIKAEPTLDLFNLVTKEGYEDEAIVSVCDHYLKRLRLEFRENVSMSR